MNDKAIAFGICALILFAVFVSGCADDGEYVVTPVIQFKLEARDKLNSSLGQNLSMLSHISGDSVKWGDIKIHISNDGATYYIITLNEEVPNLGVIMTKGANHGDETLFEMSEIIFLQEGSENWDPLNDFYIKIVHTPSEATIYENNIDVV